MAKSIKEMAKEYAKANPLYFYNADLGEVDKQTEEVEAIYESGANAVLDEIENIVINNEDNTLCMARCLVDKIKGLKGE